MDGTTTTTGTAGEDETVASGAQGAEPQLLATAVGDTCANCGARLAGDQRYCVECGTRRGKPRYAFPTTTAPAPAAASAPAMGGGYRATRWGWMSSNASLILGVGVLLLAMGVGVLIGRDSAGSSGGNGKAQVITINGAASGAAAAPPTTATTPATTAGTGSSKAKSSPTAKTKGSSPVTAAAKLPPAAKVVPKKLQSQVAKPGSTCTTGEKGCTGGKFSGTFFGGG
jgi:hypothetical protein